LESDLGVGTISVKDNEDKTALDYAKAKDENSHIVRLLEKYDEQTNQNN
jgi:hypothetical protein